MGVTSIASTAVGMLGTAAQTYTTLRAANQQYAASVEAAQNNYALTLAEGKRQYGALEASKGDVVQSWSEERSDVVRKADATLGSLRAVQAMGAGATAGSLVRLVVATAANEGRDLSRITETAQTRLKNIGSQQEAVTASVTAARQEAVNQINGAAFGANGARTAAWTGFATASLQLGTNALTREIGGVE